MGAFGVVDNVEDGLVEAVNELVDIFAYMVVEPASFVAFLVPAPSGARIALESRLIGKPDIHIGLPAKFFELLPKRLSSSFVLTVGPRLRNLQSKALPMKKANY